jgi:hypothetical protein
MSNGGLTPDRFPGTREEDEVKIVPGTSDPVDEGAIRYVSGAVRIRDASGVYDPRQGGTGMTENDHRVVDQLVHDLAEDYFEEYIYSGNQVTSVIAWTDSGKTTKIRETQFAYSGNQVTTETIIQFDEFGSEVERIVLTYAYTGNKVSNVTCVRSTP